MPDAFRLLQSRHMLFVVLAVALGSSLMLPGWLSCLWFDDGRCEANKEVKTLGLVVMVWFAVAGADWTRRWLPDVPQQTPRYLALQIIGLSVVGVALGGALNRALGGPWSISPYSIQVQATFTACAGLLLEFQQRARQQLAQGQVLRQNAQGLAQQLDTARAQLLQAQVEPHFLFNTLAHLRRLADTDPTQARAMLADLLRYLQAALPGLRREHTTLAAEIELVRAFLTLHQRRLGEPRVGMAFDIAPGLDDARLPASCLLTLAENAIKHGITPQLAGGSITVRAALDPDQPDQPGPLRLEVADTGAGMAPGVSSGGGTGLATLRARLLAAYGSRAALSLHLNEPQGLIARVRLPLERAA
jgi:signal transduction histidine kinase